MGPVVIAALAMLASAIPVEAQTTPGSDLAARIQQLEDRAALKTLVDTFSILADRKDVPTQMSLFTEDATVESRTGEQVSTLKGRQAIGGAFARYLANFETVYHMNGQHTVDIRGDKATGTYYCLVVLISNEDGKRVKNTSGVYYDDEYVRRGGTWLIAKRVAHFAWRDREEMASR